jgi:hypothetical protein
VADSKLLRRTHIEETRSALHETPRIRAGDVAPLMNRRYPTRMTATTTATTLSTTGVTPASRLRA